MDPCPIKRKVLRRFYEPVHLLWSLPPRPPPPLLRQRHPTPPLRTFLDAVAELVGDEAAAAADVRRVLFVAGCGHDSAAGLRLVLDAIVGGVEEDILLQKVVGVGGTRIEEAKRELAEGLRGTGESKVPTLRKLGGEMRGPIERLVRVCFDVMQESQMNVKILRDKLANEGVSGSVVIELTESVETLSQFQQITTTLLTTSLHLRRSLLSDTSYHIYRVPSPRPLNFTLSIQESSGNRILGRMLRDTSEMETYRRMLDALDTNIGRRQGVLSRLAQSFGRGGLRHVHPELQIIEAFRSERIAWFGGDGYVGASEAPCYLCKRYLDSLRPGEMIEMRARGIGEEEEVRLDWGPPNVRIDEARLVKMVDGIRMEVIEQLTRLYDYGPRRQGQQREYDWEEPRVQRNEVNQDRGYRRSPGNTVHPDEVESGDDKTEFFDAEEIVIRHSPYLLSWHGTPHFYPEDDSGGVNL